MHEALPRVNRFSAASFSLLHFELLTPGFWILTAHFIPSKRFGFPSKIACRCASVNPSTSIIRKR